MKKTFPLVSVILIASFLLGACAPRADIHAYGDNSLPASSVPVSVEPVLSRCEVNGATYDLNLIDETGNPIHITFCDEKKVYETGAVDIVDMAMVGTLATPWPGDEEIVAIVWSAKTILKLALVVGSAYVTGQAIAALPGHVTNEGVVVEVTGMQTANIEVSAGVRASHNPAHNIDQHISEVADHIATFQTWIATGGPHDRSNSENYKCRALVIGNQIARFMMWSKTTMNILVWSADGQWITFYGPKMANTLNNVPEEVRRDFGSKAHVEPVDCNQLPPTPPLAFGG